MKHDRIAIRTMAALGLAAALLAGCGKKESTDVEASGIIETTDITVSARAVGNVVKMNVREGDRVRAGDTLAMVDASDLEIQKRQLLAGVDVAKFQYDLVRNGARSEDVAQAEEATRQAKIALDNADDDERRYGALLKEGGIAEKDYLNIKTKRDIAERQYKSAQLALAKLRNGSRSEDVSTAQAREDQASAQLAAIDKKIEDCVVLAPADGIVTRRAVESGEFVNVGSSMLTITKTDVVKLKIYVPEDQLGRVKVGQAADLKIDTFKDKVYRGRVTYISPTAEFTPKNVQTKDDRVKLVYEVQIEVPNQNGELKSGITAEAKLLEG
jgi:HlyD family secretion protein